MTLENNRIQLRAVEPEDLEYLFQWENDTELWHLSNTLTPFSRFTLKKYIESAATDIFAAKQLRLMIERKVDGIAIGAIDLFDYDPFHRRAGVGILIAEQSQRKKGFASEALEIIIEYSFETLGLKQLFCNVTETNSDSLKLFISKGFIITGQKQSWVKIGETWFAEYFLQLLNRK
jgi:diamine N-acetyltransferase